MKDGPHRLLLASAGTGKTFQLTGRFIELLLDGVEPEHILATTFTRKAAGEVLEQLLERLANAAGSEVGLAGLRKHLGRPELTQADCLAPLALLAGRLERLQVRTLDSFFGHLGRLFALDLGLAPDWKIADEQQATELVVEAIGRLLRDLDVPRGGELLRALKSGAARRGVMDALQLIVEKIRDAWLESAPGAWTSLPVPVPVEKSIFAAALARLPDLLLPVTKKGTVDKNWSRSVEKVLTAGAACDWDSLLGVVLIQRALDQQDPVFSRRPIEGEMIEVLEVLGDHAVAEGLARLVGRNRATIDFLDRFEEVYSTLRHEQGLYRFEDIPLSLAPRGRAACGPIEDRELDLAFRLGGRIEHLLLDEFQDTAPMQWRALEPLAREILDCRTGERSFFCVGDVKQSIYGWRAAEPRLLRELDRRYPVLRPPLRMAKNWRSSPVVIESVNALFGSIAKNPVFATAKSARDRAAAARWRTGFEKHEAQHLNRGGYVELREALPHADDEPKDSPAMRLAAERVAASLQEAPGATVGVLLRSNKPIPRLIYLLREHGVRASGEGGNPLTDSVLVLATLSMLHLGDHPSDTAAAFHVESSPLATIGELDLSDPRAFARVLRARLVREGYGPTLQGFLDALKAGAESPAWELARMGQLVELAHRFDADAGLRPSAFVEWVRMERVEDPSAARVRVMTIHASKGLEFDVVVLPQLDDPMIRRSPAVLALRSDPFGTYDEVTNTPRSELIDPVPELSLMRAESRTLQVEEALSLLYVATTRARRRLEWIVRHDTAGSRDSEAFSFARLLRAGLATGEPVAPGILWRAKGSSDAWSEGLRKTSSAVATPVSRLAPAPSLRGRRLVRRSPSAEEGTGSARELLRRHDPSAATRGRLVHRWLEELVWIEDFVLDDARAHELGAPIEPDASARSCALQLLREGLESPRVRAALSSEGCAVGTARSVERERPYRLLLPNEHGVEELWTGSIDRLVIDRRDGIPIGADVIDYKTDDVTPEALAKRRRYYGPQLEAYRRAAARFLNLDPDTVRSRLLFLVPGVVIDL